ncbi:MAG: universal stress protein [Proteobacteria bacterium]|nr:universal stress protein [Pseudomonadota bacterium]MBU1741380.1 universal stress protein [Pseudomonadota bacterium]
MDLDPRRILLAVDFSENSDRAVDYTGRVVGDSPGFSITIVHVVEDPPEDFFPTEEKRLAHLEQHQAETDVLLAETKQKLVDLGVVADRISLYAPVKECASMAACIIEEQQQDNFGTVVVGRRGVSKKEEFLFGSVSNRIIHYAKGCTVWVVE